MLKFDAFEVDLETGELRRCGVRVALQEKPFQLLAALLERPGEVVSRERLRQRLWPDVTVDFDGSLNAAVKKLREALGDSASRPRFVETVPRRGYRFLGTLKPSECLSRAAAPVWPRRWVPAGALTLALVVTLVVAARFRPADPRRSADAGRPVAVAEERVLLAVLPFVNLSGDPAHDYVCDGMTEEMIAALGRLQPDRLGVIARITAMTYRQATGASGVGAAASKRVDEIGRELGVDYVLEGSIRGDAQQSRITAQLIAVADQTHLWAETYDTDLANLLKVQEEIARRIAHALAFQLLGSDSDAAARTATAIPEAYDHYLRGRYQWNRFTGEGYRIAIEELRRALELDPGYARAYAALADAYSLQAFAGEGAPGDWLARARQAADRALELDPNLAPAHASLAFTLLYGQFDAAAADPLFRRAVELDPNDAMGYHWHAGALAALGRHDEAIAAVRRSLELDPLSLSVQSDLGWYFLFAGRFDEALRECRSILEISPGYGWAVSCAFEALSQLGRTEEAVRLSLDQLQDAGDLPRPAPGFEDLPAPAAARKLLEFRLDRELGKGAGANPLSLAIVYSRLGDADGAFRALERALALRDPWLVFLEVDPRFGPLREDPRFANLAARLLDRS